MANRELADFGRFSPRCLRHRASGEGGVPAVTVSLTQCLVELCHLWMIPACGLGLMAAGGQQEERGYGEADDEKKEIRTF